MKMTANQVAYMQALNQRYANETDRLANLYTLSPDATTRRKLDQASKVLVPAGSALLRSGSKLMVGGRD